MARRVRSPKIVDTNVPLVANGDSEAGPACVASCTMRLNELMQKGRIVIDGAWRIIREYTHKLSPSGQPGLGDAFLKWVLTNQANPDRCILVAITPLDNDSDDFEEFPESLRAVGFDRSDRKFVAVAVAHGGSPPILQALDSKWWGWRQQLAAEGINVDFLCPKAIAAKYEQKMN
jgi:hypothetical protein